MATSRSAAPIRGDAPRIEPFRYAVIDLASARSLRPVVLRTLASAAEPLFAPTQARAVLQVAPWLVRLSKAAEVEAALGELGPDVPWGYQVYSTFDILSLRRSLRRFNLARIPGAEREVLFRYWDPRVMRLFLEVATRQQRERFFELIELIEIGDHCFRAQ